MHVCEDIIRLPEDTIWSFQFTDIKILNIGIFTNSTKDRFFPALLIFHGVVFFIRRLQHVWLADSDQAHVELCN